MNKKKSRTKISGAALALAMAGLSGCAIVDSWKDGEKGSSASGSSDLVHCYGVNKCNGHNDCQTANNACEGKASCTGMGFVTMSSKSCADIGGEIKDEWVGQIENSELIQCYDVNVCQGHNDCSTDNNNCKGHAKCKGAGFVNMPAKACTDIGGKQD